MKFRIFARTLTVLASVALGSDAWAFFEKEAAPFTQQAARKVEANIDNDALDKALVEAKTQCSLSPKVKCAIAPLKVIDSWYSKAGYSFDKTMQKAYTSDENARAS